MTATIQTSIPHAGGDTLTLMVALEILDLQLLDGADDDLIVTEIGRLVRDCLADRRARKVLTWATEDLGHSLDELVGLSKHEPLVHDRHELMLRLREAGWSLPKIGRMLCRHHTTVLDGCRRAEERRLLSGQVRFDGQAA